MNHVNMADKVCFLNMSASEGVQWAAGKLDGYVVYPMTDRIHPKKIRHAVYALRLDDPFLKSLVLKSKLKLNKPEWYGEEGFEIKRLLSCEGISHSSTLIVGATDKALMYGLLELEEGRDKPDFSYVPPFKIRAFMRWLPFRLGQHYMQESYEVGEHRFDWWWYDETWWTEMFQRLAYLRYNTFTLWNIHPFPALIKYNKYPEAALFSEEETEKNIVNFRKVVSKGKAYGIRVVVKQYNSYYSPGLAKKHSLRELRQDGWTGSLNELTRDYARYCLSELFRTYPEMEGFMFCMGEVNVDNYAYVKETIIDELNKLNTKPFLIARLWGVSFPARMRELIQSYKGEMFLAQKTSEERIIKPVVDSRFAQWKRDVPEAKMIAQFGPGYAPGVNMVGQLFADPSFIRGTMNDLLQKDGSGVEYFTGFDNWSAKKRVSPDFTEAEKDWLEVNWLGIEAAGKYSWNPAEEYEQEYWIERVQSHYGMHENGDVLLRAMRSATGIVPRVYCLFSPPYDGTPYGVARTIGPFTCSSCADPDGDFMLGNPYAYPFHVWGEDVLSIPEYVKNVDAQATTPLQIADEIEAYARTSVADLVKVGPKIKNQSRLQALTKYVRISSLIGMHNAARIRAGVELYSGIFANDKKSFLKSCEKGIGQLGAVIRHGRELTAHAKGVFLPEGHNGHVGAYSNPFLIERDLPSFEEDLNRWKEVMLTVNETDVDFQTIKKYWLSHDYYNSVQNHIRRSYFIQESRLRKADEAIQKAIELACKASDNISKDIVAGQMLSKWIEFLHSEKARLEAPQIECIKVMDSPKENELFNESWCQRAEKQILVNNDAFEPLYGLETSLLSLFKPVEFSRAVPKTVLSVTYDDYNFYLCLRGFVEDIKDCNEYIDVSLAPGHTHKKFYWLEIYYNGTKLEMESARRELLAPHGLTFDRTWKSNWDIRARLQTDGWSMVVTIPFEEFGGLPRPGTIWGLNVTRSRREKYEDIKKETAWPSSFGYLLGNPSRMGQIIFR